MNKFLFLPLICNISFSFIIEYGYILNCSRQTAFLPEVCRHSAHTLGIAESNSFHSICSNIRGSKIAGIIPQSLSPNKYRLFSSFFPSPFYLLSEIVRQRAGDFQSLYHALVWNLPTCFDIDIPFRSICYLWYLTQRALPFYLTLPSFVVLFYFPTCRLENQRLLLRKPFHKFVTCPMVTKSYEVSDIRKVNW